MINTKIHTSVKQKDEPKFFSLLGMTSEMTKNGSGVRAKFAIKITNEKLPIGM